MAAAAIFRFAFWCVSSGSARLEGLRLASKLAAAASVCVACIAMYLAGIVSNHIRDHAEQQAAATVALYMDSFVASHVQELATQNTLSVENSDALEKLLSPASMHRPIVAFRIWKGDMIVFSNERSLVGKIFARSSARERAMQGRIGVELESPNGDDDEQVRSLKVPVLEVYAPVRQKGTGRIIALAETYEIAVALTNEMRLNQIAVWISAIGIALAIILLLFSMVGTSSTERSSLLGQIGELSRLQEESELQKRRIAHANMKVSQHNESSLRLMETRLQQGPVQNVTLALLKLDPGHWIVSNSDGAALRNATQCREDIEAIRDALGETIKQMRGVCVAAVPDHISDLTARETLASAARECHRRTGLTIEYDFAGLPEKLPLSLKACLYRIVLEGLCSAAGGVRSQSIRCSLDNNSIAVEIVRDASHEDRFERITSLRDRVEALGGTLQIHSASSGRTCLIAELDLTGMGIAVG